MSTEDSLQFFPHMESPVLIFSSFEIIRIFSFSYYLSSPEQSLSCILFVSLLNGWTQEIGGSPDLSPK